MRIIEKRQFANAAEKRRFYQHATNGKYDLSKTDLQGHDLSGMNFCSYDFSESNFKNVNFANANLHSADFWGADLTNTNLRGAELTRANITEANLIKACLINASLRGADLTETDLGSADFTGADLTKANFSGADLTEANFFGANLAGADLTGANLNGANLEGTKPMKQYTELLTAIAAHLGAPWKFNKLKQGASWQRELIDGQGRTLLFISDPRYPSKFEIAGIIDSKFAFTSNGARLSIKVSVSRTAKALANDIKRRLLPEYFMIFNATREYGLVIKKETEQFDYFTHAFMTATNGKKDPKRWNSANRVVQFEDPNNPYEFHNIAQLHRYDDKIVMHLSNLTFEQAVKIANILRDTT